MAKEDPMNPDFYSSNGIGSAYNYEANPKENGFLESYFSLPVLKAFLKKIKVVLLKY